MRFRFSGGPIPFTGPDSGPGFLLYFVLFSLVVLGFVELGLMLLMLLMLMMFSCIVDCSLAPLLSMRRRFKAVMDVLDSMIRNGVSLSRSVELTAQWDRILALGPMHPVTLDDLSFGGTLDLGAFFSCCF